MVRGTVWVCLAALCGVACVGSVEVSPGAESDAASGGSTTTDATGGSASSASDATTDPTAATTSAGPDPSTTDPTASDATGSSSATEGSSSGIATTGDPAATLAPLRIEHPCTGGGCGSMPEDTCLTVADDIDDATLMGDAGVVYDVTFRVRGVVEMADYAGGDFDGAVYVGGSGTSGWNSFRLTTSDPPQTYWLNPLGSGDYYTQPVDTTFIAPVADGATVELYGGAGGDQCSIFNHDQVGNPIVVRNIPPAPAAFDGQFLQVDVVSIVAK
jgi:hypothetical protein